MKTILLTLLITLPPFQGGVFAQQAAPGAAETRTSAGPASSPATRNKKAIPGFLILGTVFNQNSLAFPGVLVRVRRKGDKKYRWETFTNSRGEFAVRVPEGQNYEVAVHHKNFQDQIQEIKTDIGDTQQRLSIRLAPLQLGETGAKP